MTKSVVVVVVVVVVVGAGTCVAVVVAPSPGWLVRSNLNRKYTEQYNVMIVKREDFKF